MLAKSTLLTLVPSPSDQDKKTESEQDIKAVGSPGAEVFLFPPPRSGRYLNKGLRDVVDAFQRHLYMPDPKALLAALGCVAGNRLDGPSLSMVIIGAPSSGKNMIIEACFDLPNTHHISTVTEAALLSGTSKKDRTVEATGGLLMEIGIGGSGMLLISEFNSILSMGPDQRLSTLGSLRDVCTGFLDRPVGSDGGRRLKWNGRVGILAGCTEGIYQHQQVMATMGERMIYCQMPDSDRRQQGRAALRAAADEHSIQHKIERRALVTEMFEALKIPKVKDLISHEEQEHLLSIADLVTRARSAVPRDAHSGEVQQVFTSEQVPRMLHALHRLMHGMILLGVPHNEAWSIVCKVALDSIPAIRKTIIDIFVAGMIKGEDGYTLTELTSKLSVFSKLQVGRFLTDMKIHKVLKCRVSGMEDLWSLTGWAQEMIFGSFDLDIWKQPAQIAE